MKVNYGYAQFDADAVSDFGKQAQRLAGLKPFRLFFRKTARHLLYSITNLAVLRLF